jgi:hypothetical protein
VRGIRITDEGCGFESGERLEAFAARDGPRA